MALDVNGGRGGGREGSDGKVIYTYRRDCKTLFSCMQDVRKLMGQQKLKNLENGHKMQGEICQFVACFFSRCSRRKKKSLVLTFEVDGI